MPKVDFANIENAQDYAPLPEGEYTCRIAKVEEASTKAGDEMWRLHLEVIEGEHAGRFIFDNMVFSTAAMKRVKLICSRLGIDVSGETNLTTSMIRGRACKVSVTIEDYEDQDGNVKSRNTVPFTGYEEADLSSIEIDDDIGEESTPF